jgi:hypothetical protein
MFGFADNAQQGPTGQQGIGISPGSKEPRTQVINDTARSENPFRQRIRRATAGTTHFICSLLSATIESRQLENFGLGVAGPMSVFRQFRQFIIHRMNRDERHAYVMRRAFDLARTGDYPDWSSIEIELCARENFPEARQWLATRAVRNELDRTCKDAGDRGLASRRNA